MPNTNTSCHIDEFYHNLLGHLQRSQRVAAVSDQFSKLTTNADRVSFAYSLLDEYKLFPELIKDVKNDELADAYRNEGNEMYKRKKIKEAIELYTQSVANAVGNLEMLALAYANRSAALFEKGFYEDCLKDIDRALENNYPDNLKGKLLSRQRNALNLKSREIFQPFHHKIPEITTDQRNERIQCATNAVEIRHTEDLGRHVVAIRDIEIGDIIAIENPFCHVLSSDYSIHCHECLQLCYSLIPCDNCTSALYCSVHCKTKSSVYHKYECQILRTLRELQLDKMKLLPLKIAIMTKDINENTAVNNLNEEYQNIYLSDRYLEIHNLVDNTESRVVSDLFRRSVDASVMFNLIRTYSDIFNSDEEKDKFGEILLLHMQTAPCNFHSISEIAENAKGIYVSDDIGAGAYSFLSMFNHSCNPNVVRQSFGPVLVLRAIRSIRKGDQCFDNYGYHHAVMPRSERKLNLMQQYFFECSCEACANDWPLYPDLPSIKDELEVDKDYYKKLMEGDAECAEEVLCKLLPRMKELEIFLPNKEFAEKQEIVKQCLALLGNIRKTI